MQVTGDFIVMASTLMLIKSRMLLPTEEVDLEEEIDPRDELIQQLLEYKKYKTLSRALDERGKDRALRVGRPGTLDHAAATEVPLEEVGMWDLVKAFAKVLDDTGHGWGSTIVHTERPISAYIEDIITVLEGADRIEFTGLFEGSRTREDVLGLFIGILELTRLSVIRLSQPEPGGEILIALRVDRERLGELKVIDIEAALLEREEAEPKTLWREKVTSHDDERSAEAPSAEATAEEPADEAPMLPAEASSVAPVAESVPQPAKRTAEEPAERSAEQ
jgi:segregation and condensation protein A